MAINCCDIPNYLHSLPSAWRDAISSALCEIIKQQVSVDCDKVRECETLTSISQLTLSEDGVLSFVYTDEHSEENYREVNLNDIVVSPIVFRNGLNSPAENIAELGLNPLLHDTEIPLDTFNLVIQSSANHSNHLNAIDTQVIHSEDTDLDTMRAVHYHDSEEITDKIATNEELDGEDEYLIKSLSGIYADGNTVIGTNVPTSPSGEDEDNTNYFSTDTLNAKIYSKNIYTPLYPNTRDDSGDFIPENFIYTDEDGYVKSSSLSALTGIISSGIDGRNGVSKVGGFIELGGTDLEHDSSIGGEYTLSITEGQFTVETTAFGRAVAITNTNPLTNSEGVVGSYSTSIFDNGAFVNTVENAYAGSVGEVVFGVSGNTTLLNDIPYTGVLGYATASTDSIVTAGTISALATRTNIVNDGTYNNIAGLHVTSPVTSPTGGQIAFTGSIAEYDGIRVEDLTAYIDSIAINKLYGIRQLGDLSNYFEGVLHLGPTNDPETSTYKSTYPAVNDRPRLNVFKQTGFAATPTQSASYSALYVTGAGSDTVTDIYAGSLGVAFYGYDTDQVLRNVTNVSGIVGLTLIESDADVTGDGVISGVTGASVVLSKSVGTLGTANNVAAFRAMYPRQEAYAYSVGRIFAGITNAYGIIIENQRLDAYSTPITNSWGVYQEGTLDKNYFEAQTSIGTSTINATAKFQVESTTLGSLPAPRMTTTQRNAIAGTKPSGLLIFNTDTEEYQYWKQSTTSWITL